MTVIALLAVASLSFNFKEIWSSFATKLNRKNNMQIIIIYFIVGARQKKIKNIF